MDAEKLHGVTKTLQTGHAGMRALDRAKEGRKPLQVAAYRPDNPGLLRARA